MQVIFMMLSILGSVPIILLGLSSFWVALGDFSRKIHSYGTRSSILFFLPILLGCLATVLIGGLGILGGVLVLGNSIQGSFLQILIAAVVLLVVVYYLKKGERVLDTVTLLLLIAFIPGSLILGGILPLIYRLL